MSRDFQLPGRSQVIAGNGMAATSQPLATLAAIETLRSGGNAADAAIAAVSTLCVVEPHMTGIGGDCFCLVSRPDKPVWGYNGSGRSAATASMETLRAQGISKIDMNSIHAVTVPGAVDAWVSVLETHGLFDLGKVLAPAIRYAEEGFPVTARVAWDWSRSDKLKNDPGALRHYLFDGRAPREGDIIKFPALASSLKLIAAGGSRAFYEGPIADDIVTTVAARGSFLTKDDFSRHKGDVVVPISTSYRGVDLVELPPNGQGVTALVLLNILENFDLASHSLLGPERFHLLLEAARLAYAVRNTHIADPNYLNVEVSALLDKVFAASLARRIDPLRRVELPVAPTPGSDTVYVTVVDRDRMAVSIINSLYAGFGSGICTEKTGILLQSRGAGFVMDVEHPNTFGPSKRPMHTIIPALVFRNNCCEMSFGVMGGAYQPMGHVQVLLNILDHGLDVQQAIDMPRAFFDGNLTTLERGMPQETADGLRKLGHEIAYADLPLGGAQAIHIDWQRGVLIGGSDPRKDGCALGY